MRKRPGSCNGVLGVEFPRQLLQDLEVYQTGIRVAVILVTWANGKYAGHLKMLRAIINILRLHPSLGFCERPWYLNSVALPTKLR